MAKRQLRIAVWLAAIPALLLTAGPVYGSKATRPATQVDEGQEGGQQKGPQ